MRHCMAVVSSSCKRCNSVLISNETLKPILVILLGAHYKQLYLSKNKYDSLRLVKDEVKSL